VHNIRFSVLASGSRGNACYLETEKTRILIDAGLSCQETEHRLKQVGVQPNTLDALLITHEHTDHIKGAGPLARRYDLPVYTNLRTFEKARKKLGNISRPVIFQTGQTLTINHLSIETFTKCHDAADPFGLVFAYNGIRAGMITDFGRSTRLVEDRLKGCQALIMEFNYDQKMLDEGPYPLDLKRRINGNEGHLSNHQAGKLLKVVSNENLRVVVLAHLSETNNHPSKARHAAVDALCKCGLSGTEVLISNQDDPGAMFEL
jgi:phosphoribosyl 1,2-cyclic phosphodiesterase